MNLLGASISAAVALTASVLGIVHGAQRDCTAPGIVLDARRRMLSRRDRGDRVVQRDRLARPTSPTTGKACLRARRSRAWYYLGFLPVLGRAARARRWSKNLGVAWLLVEATTGASALLVAYSGRRNALEAGWKYLVLTTFGLAVALLGILILFVGLAPHGGDACDARLAAASPATPAACHTRRRCSR